MSKPFDSRVGAYALITRDEHVLLTHWNPRHPGFDGAWTLPGGGMEPGEQPEQTMILYTAHVTGGELAVEQNGSSDDAAWFPIARIDSLKRLDLVDQGLRLSGLTSAVADPDTPPEDIPEQDVATEPGRDR